MRRFAALMLMAPSGCFSAEAPEFTFRLVQIVEFRTEVLLEETFTNYESAKLSSPFTVPLSESGRMQDVVQSIGYCEEIAGCAGPLQLEQIVLTLQPAEPDHIAGYQCVGLDGARLGGIDVTNRGDCE